jgi:hypothetical protein
MLATVLTQVGLGALVNELNAVQDWAKRSRSRLLILAGQFEPEVILLAVGWYLRFYGAGGSAPVDVRCGL